MVFVALAMVAIIAMAALSIDVITLYLAREEAQRSADQAALAAARILSVAGITGDPSNGTGNWGAICGPNGVATHAAQAMVAQNTVGRLVPGTINVTYAAGNGGAITSSTDCQTLASNSAFGTNPMVTVQLTRASLPTFFSRIWGNAGNSVSATATAEAFNPSKFRKCRQSSHRNHHSCTTAVCKTLGSAEFRSNGSTRLHNSELR